MISSPMSVALRRVSQGALAGVLVAGLAARALAAPKAVLVEPRQQDVGEVEPDKIQHFTYTLRNGGDAPLLIVALDPTCYCTTVKADANEIAPGTTTSIHVTIDPSDFVGNITKGFELTTNDPQDSKAMVEIALKVRPGLAVVPPELDFGTVAAEGSKSLTVDLKASKERPFHVKQVTPGAPFLTVSQEEIPDLEERTGVRLTVKVSSGVPAGPFASRLVVLTDDVTKPTLEIPVHGSGPGGLQAEPAKLVSSAAKPGAEVGSFEVSGGKVSGVKTSDPSLVAALVPLPSGHYRVKVTLAAAAKPGKLLAKVLVATGDAAQPGLSVPVIVTVR